MTEYTRALLSGTGTVGRICHELRRPITAIQAFADLLDDEVAGPLGDEQREYVRTILRNALALEHQVTRVFELAEVDASSIELELADHDLEDLCRLAEQRHAEAFEQSGVSLTVESTAASLMLHVDGRRLLRVIEHLLLTALRASPEAGRVRFAAGGRDDSVWLEVRVDEWLRETDAVSPGVDALTTTALSESIVRTYVAALGGHVHTRSFASGRRQVLVELPAATAASTMENALA